MSSKKIKLSSKLLRYVWHIEIFLKYEIFYFKLCIEHKTQQHQFLFEPVEWRTIRFQHQLWNYFFPVNVMELNPPEIKYNKAHTITGDNFPRYYIYIPKVVQVFSTQIVAPKTRENSQILINWRLKQKAEKKNILHVKCTTSWLLCFIYLNRYLTRTVK